MRPEASSAEAAPLTADLSTAGSARIPANRVGALAHSTSPATTNFQVDAAFNTQRSYGGGSCVAPHHLAVNARRDVLKQGGNAVEAIVAAAAAYPHMNALGGDGFWLINEPGKAPVAIDTCGGAAQLATPDFYAGKRDTPERGAEATLTMAGTFSGWQKALDIGADWGTPLPLGTILRDAIRYAEQGIAVSRSQAVTRKHVERLSQSPGFNESFLIDGEIPLEGQRLRQPRLAATPRRLASAGLDDFYRGELAQSMAMDLEALGSPPLRLKDFHDYQAQIVTPL